MGEVTIDSIQIEIESNSTNASRGLDALAGSLEKLKKNGSFKTVSNNPNNLSAALKNLPNLVQMKALLFSVYLMSGFESCMTALALLGAF